MRCPALLVSAPASGQGKTTVVAALARLLGRRGARVRVFKCGPDFLDPFWHELASGHAVHSLDLWMTGEMDARARLHAAAQAADVILVEGVMGLHDGTPSSADLARALGLPVLAVIQAGAMAQTLGVGSQSSAEDTSPAAMDALKPRVRLVKQADRIEIRFVRGKLDGVNIYSRKKGESAWRFLDRVRHSPALDSTPAGTPGQPEVREYRVLAVYKNREVGLPSDILTATVGE